MKYLLTILSIGMASLTVLQAGAFTNLDFESANTNNVTRINEWLFYGSTKDLLPGWTLTDVKGQQATNIFFNSSTPGGSPLPILEMKDQNSYYPIDGQYAFRMVSGSTDPMFITQRGTIPLDYKYISFKSFNHVSLSIDGTPLQVQEIAIWESDPTILKIIQYQAWSDITTYAGQEVTLTFGSERPNPYTGCGIDSIQFTSTIVPEPSTVVLFGLGGLVSFVQKLRFH